MCSCFEQKTRAVGAGCTTWTDPAARSDARDISQNIRCLEDIRAHLFRRESRRYNVLRPGMRNNLVAGLGDCPNDLRETLRKNSTGHHACANPGSDEHIQEPFGYRDWSRSFPRGERWNRTRRPAMYSPWDRCRGACRRPCLIGYIKDDRHAPIARPTKIAAQTLCPRPSGNDVRIARHGSAPRSTLAAE